MQQPVTWHRLVVPPSPQQESTFPSTILLSSKMLLDSLSPSHEIRVIVGLMISQLQIEASSMSWLHLSLKKRW